MIGKSTALSANVSKKPDVRLTSTVPQHEKTGLSMIGKAAIVGLKVGITALEMEP